MVMHEPLSNLRKVIFVQCAHGTPRSEIWRGLHGAATLLAVGESKRDEKLPANDHAAWTALCELILNLDEAITKE